ncbi:MAG: hypothetical protein E7293_01680 [Lachnospiraceae bacterium]|nr:hypothetical protein [Lachnospiraceae bacterium]
MSRRSDMKDLTKGNLYKNFLLFAIPMVLSSVLSQGYSIINTVIAGKLIGESALAAIGAVSPFETFLNSIFWGYGGGVGIYAANLFGSGKFYRLKQMVLNNMIMLSGILVLISAVILICKEPLYSLLQIDTDILREADRYFTISMLGKVAVLFNVNIIFVFNAMGDGAFPFYMSFISAICNIGGNFFTVMVLGMGVEGMALSTVLSACIVALCYCLKLAGYFRQLGLGGQKARYDLQVLKETWHYSFSTMIQQSVMYFSSMVLSPMVNGIGSAASASYTVTLRIYEINASIYQNSSKTVGNYIAQCYGAKKYHNFRKGMRVGVIQSLLFVLPVLGVCVCLPETVSGLFYKEDAPGLSVEYTVLFLKYYLPFIFLNVFANLFHNFFRGIARMKALLIATVAGSLARIVISLLLIGPLGIHGIYVGWVMSWVFDAGVGVYLYLRGKWRVGH